MENPEKHYMVDVGGGPDWWSLQGHGDWLLKEMKKLRTAQLAAENPHINYIVLDMGIPYLEAQTIHKELPNLHFVTHRIAQPSCIPFSDTSVERVEINHMWTPLTAIPSVVWNRDIKGISGATDYLYVLKQSCRILKSDGILSITEKKDRLQKIRYMLSKSFYDLDLDGMWMGELGLDYDPKKHVLTQITNPNRSMFTYLAFAQEEDVYCLELRKK